MSTATMPAPSQPQVAVAVLNENGKPTFVSALTTQAEAEQLQRLMQEGNIVDAATARLLKDQMVNR